MKTIVLPGFSAKNREWAEEVAQRVDGEIEVITYPHWETGKAEKGWKEEIVEQILKKYEGEKINIVAKSVGTIVAMMLLVRNPNIINRIILCGIPIADFEAGDKNIFEILQDFSTRRLLCVQNDNDPLAKYQEVERMLHAINMDINIVSKPASTHHYPYYDEFKSFLVD